MAVNWDSNSINTLFSSLPSRNSGFFGSGSSTSNNMLSDYFSIKNGSYGKLMKAYYSSNSEEVSKIASKDVSKATTKKNEVSSEAKTASEVKSAANSLKDSANALIDSKLYEKVSSVDSKGNKTEAVDMDKLYGAVNDFVDSYNKTLKSGADSDSRTVLNNVSSMTDYSRFNSKMLSKIGISIGTDNSLKLDEETFKNADVNDVRSLFGTRGGYGYQMSALASSTSYAASNSFNTGYTSAGNYALNAASSFSDVV